MDSAGNTPEVSGKTPGIASNLLALLNAGDAGSGGGAFAGILAQVQVSGPEGKTPPADALPPESAPPLSVGGDAGGDEDKTALPLPPGWYRAVAAWLRNATIGCDGPGPCSGDAPVANPFQDENALPSDALINAGPAFGWIEKVSPPSCFAPAVPDSGDSAASGNTDAGTDVTDEELALLLSQLSQLVARHLAAPSGDAGDSASGASADAADPAPVLADGPQNKADLRALLAALVKMHERAAAALDADTQADGLQTGNASDVSSSAPASAEALLRDILSGKNDPSAFAAVKNAWADGDFLKLFKNFVRGGSDPNPAGGFSVSSDSLAAVPGNALPASASGGDGAGLDADPQNPGGSVPRNAADMLAVGNPATPAAHPANPYDFASQLSALRFANGGPLGLPGAVEQVMLRLNRAAKDGSSQMSIQLQPAELGRIDIRLDVAGDGKVRGTVVASNPATLDLLLKDVRGLERALQDAGLRADSGSLQFSLRGDGQPGGAFAQTGDGGSSGFDASGRSAPAVLAAAAPDEAEIWYVAPGRVNLRV